MLSTIQIQQIPGQEESLKPSNPRTTFKGAILMKTRMFLLAALVAAVLLGGYSQGAFAKGGGTKTRINLTAAAGYPTAKGKATYKVNGSEREFQVEVENIKQLAGKKVGIFVNGAQVGSAAVDALGAARLNLNSDLGNAVPAIKAGDKVEVRKSGGALVASGKF